MVVGSIPTVGVTYANFYFLIRAAAKKIYSGVCIVGFEPTHPKILRPERSALDRSAKNAYVYGEMVRSSAMTIVASVV